jgi:hypothetical protein
MVLPVVPGTDDILAVEAAFAQRATRVIADARDGSELSVGVREGDAGSADGDLAKRGCGEVFDGTEVVPLSIGHGRPRLKLTVNGRRLTGRC